MAGDESGTGPSESELDEVPLTGTSLVWLSAFRGGDEASADALFARYFERLSSLARSRLSARLASRVDPDDIVMSVYRSFFVDARSGRYVLSRSGDLWRLLASITKHKLLRQVRHHRADRRSVEREMPLDQVVETQFTPRVNEPTAEDAVALADELEVLFSQLNEFSRRVLELRLQGAELTEIAENTGRSERTVRRTLSSIKQVMAERLPND